MQCRDKPHQLRQLICLWCFDILECRVVVPSPQCPLNTVGKRCNLIESSRQVILFPWHSGTVMLETVGWRFVFLVWGSLVGCVYRNFKLFTQDEAAFGADDIACVMVVNQKTLWMVWTTKFITFFVMNCLDKLCQSELVFNWRVTINGWRLTEAIFCKTA